MIGRERLNPVAVTQQLKPLSFPSGELRTELEKTYSLRRQRPRIAPGCPEVIHEEIAALYKAIYLSFDAHADWAHLRCAHYKPAGSANTIWLLDGCNIDLVFAKSEIALQFPAMNQSYAALFRAPQYQEMRGP
ncbi:hypothetical protein CDO26_34020 (plasmid) [Sinorhizobium meliloti]|uniref:hypothetical protein n=1 Tax=Rhizobium meliloti TaxID=382 RepID=UPI000B499B18|nr:hypothetical protein [Sinorhizobium meliloti]ASP89339.1 hypothetical protein CDO26_34020 [Sinorhizobium meliloti]MQW24172.1 hypothetical protein [Sinorhizobium meliloti]